MPSSTAIGRKHTIGPSYMKGRAKSVSLGNDNGMTSVGKISFFILFNGHGEARELNSQNENRIKKQFCSIFYE
jgi:hypothetical protein